jgi:hypothetical protein
MRPPAHYNPTPRFGLVTDDVACERWERGYARYLDEEAERNGWCLDCGDTFRFDDCGGYNPPCKCGYHCRHCHEAAEGRLDPDDYDDYRDDEDDS